MAKRHDVHRERSARGHPFQGRQGGGVGQPRLVGQHVQARRVQVRDGPELRPIAACEDDDVPAPLVDKRLLRVIRLVDVEVPVRGIVVASVEGAHQGDERVTLGSFPCVEMNVRGHARVALAQGEGGVKVTGFEEEQRVHGGWLALESEGNDRRCFASSTNGESERLMQRQCVPVAGADAITRNNPFISTENSVARTAVSTPRAFRAPSATTRAKRRIASGAGGLEHGGFPAPRCRP